MDLIPGLAAGLLLVLVCRRARLGPEVALVGAALVSWLLPRVTADIPDPGTWIAVLLLPALFRVGTLLGTHARTVAPLATATHVVGKVGVRVFFCSAALYLWILPAFPQTTEGTLAEAIGLGTALALVAPTVLASHSLRPSDRSFNRFATWELVVGLVVLQTLPHAVGSGWQQLFEEVGLVAISVITGVAVGFLGGVLHRRPRDGMGRSAVDLATGLAAFQVSSLLGSTLGAPGPDLATVLLAGLTRSMTSASSHSGRPESLREEGFWNTTTLVTTLLILTVAGASYPDLFRLTELGWVVTIWIGVFVLQTLLSLAFEHGASVGARKPTWGSTLFASWAGQPGVFALAGLLVYGLVGVQALEAVPGAHVVLRVLVQVVLLSLLFRGLTGTWATRLCFPEGPESARSRWDLLEAKRIALKAGLDRLIDLREEMRISDVPYETIRRALTRELNELDAERSTLRSDHPDLERHAWNRVLQEVLDEARMALDAARARGDVSAEAAREFELVLSKRWLDASADRERDALSDG